MRYELECNIRGCRKRVWCSGWREYDLSAFGINDEDLPDDTCRHIYEGDYSIIDEEEESDE